MPGDSDRCLRHTSDQVSTHAVCRDVLSRAISMGYRLSEAWQSSSTSATSDILQFQQGATMFEANRGNQSLGRVLGQLVQPRTLECTSISPSFWPLICSSTVRGSAFVTTIAEDL
ncbi:MAG: hypothetical protein MJE77_06070 [Proteobacteria bacterium]|nr:hypothetical protein [Pseudomonadota bacterium]